MSSSGTLALSLLNETLSMFFSCLPQSLCLSLDTLMERKASKYVDDLHPRRNICGHARAHPATRSMGTYDQKDCPCRSPRSVPKLMLQVSPLFKPHLQDAHAANALEARRSDVMMCCACNPMRITRRDGEEREFFQTEETCILVGTQKQTKEGTATHTTNEAKVHQLCHKRHGNPLTLPL